jgi:hypothetical protein
MARKKITPVEADKEVTQPKPEEVTPVEKIYIVPLANLRLGRVCVVDERGNKYRLAETFRVGIYQLESVPEA